MEKKNRTSAEYQDAYLTVGARLAANRTLSYLMEDYYPISTCSASIIDEDAYKLEILQTLMAKLRSETELLKSKISEKERRKAAETSYSPDRTFVGNPTTGITSTNG